MSNVALNWAWGVKTGSPSAKLVLIALADQARPDGLAWPSVATIARRTDLSERAVQKHVAGLERLGLMTIERRSGRSSRYRLAIGKGGAPSAPLPPNDVQRWGARGAPKPSLNPQEEPTPFPPQSGGSAKGAGSSKPKDREEDSAAERLCTEIAIAWNEIIASAGAVGCQEETMSTRRYRRLVAGAVQRLGSVATARRLFTAMADDPFYTGESSSGWRPDLGWVLNSKNLSGLMERFEIWRASA